MTNADSFIYFTTLGLGPSFDDFHSVVVYTPFLEGRPRKSPSSCWMIIL